ncbi:MAG: alanine racemase [Actinomycetota bacterium]|nr:alanine racemase [Actinomycetota bacterium]
MTRVDRPAWADVDLGAIAHNVGELKRFAGRALLCVVVKADGYGHGAVEVSRAALDAGADALAVAMVSEGLELRDAGIDAPVLVLSETPADALDLLDLLVGNRLEPTVYSPSGIAALVSAAERIRPPEPVACHLKIDTGMHRVGAAPADAVVLAAAIGDAADLTLASVWTHCAVADEPANPFTAVQLSRFAEIMADLDAAGIRPPLLHAANSATALAHPGGRLDMVRCGIAVYGIAPFAAARRLADLRPALSLSARVSFVKTVAAGERLSYGLRYCCERDSVIATVPIGYADGVRRRLSTVGGEVLIGGRRRPIAGTVTMDQILVDCGDDSDVRIGDEVVLIGAQGQERITAEDWAARLDTIGYEIVCGIGPRVQRRYDREQR